MVAESGPDKSLMIFNFCFPLSSCIKLFIGIFFICVWKLIKTNLHGHDQKYQTPLWALKILGMFENV